MFLLLGAIYVHHLPQLLGQVGLGPGLLQDQASHVTATAVVLLLPGAVAAATDGLMRLSAGDLHFMLSLHCIISRKEDVIHAIQVGRCVTGVTACCLISLPQPRT